jgi:hypothetical protein
MKQLLIPLRKGVALFLAIYFLCLALPIKSERIAPLDKDKLRLQLALMSDLHTEGNNIGRFKINTQSVKHLDAVKDTADALVLLGDNTMNGYGGEALFFYGLMETVNPIRPYYPIIGNHDVGNGDASKGSFEEQRERQLDYLNTFVDRSLTELYYSKTLHDYTLIFLAPDSLECHERNYSDAQLDFLEAQLDAAAERGKPVFVFTHYPASHVEQGYARYRSLVTKYPNTFVVVGHMHYYVRFDTIRGGDYRTPEIWVPCLSMMEDDGSPNDKSGLGFLMEAYDETVVFRGINFYTGELTDVEQTYRLQTQTPAEPDDDDIPIAIGY